MDEANAIARDYPECIEKAELPYRRIYYKDFEIYEFYLSNGWKITYDYIDKIAYRIVNKGSSPRPVESFTNAKHYLYILLKKYNAPITDVTIMVLLNDMAYMLINKTSNIVLSENFTIFLQDINYIFESCIDSLDSLYLDNLDYIDIPYRRINKKMYINILLEKIPRSCASSTRIFKTILSISDKELLDKYLNICEHFNTKKNLYKCGPYMWCYDEHLTSMFKRLILNEIPVNKVSFPLCYRGMFYHSSQKRQSMLKLAISLGFKVNDNMLKSSRI
jgi:hypothetical protein